MPAVIPPPLTPYVLPGQEGSLTLVLSVLDATTNWLLLRYIYAALCEQDPTDKHGPPSGSVVQDHQENFKVLFVSILRGFEQWREMGKKVGLDFPSLVASKRLVYFDGLIHPTTSPSSQPQNLNVVPFDLSSLQGLESLVRRYSEQNQKNEHASKTILIMDGIDFLLASQPSITSLALSRTIMTLRQHVYNTILTSSADYPLLHNPSPLATPLESEHRGFVTTLAHQSRIAVQLRSLETGAAKDISGVLRVSAGGAHDDFEGEDAGFEEGEWLYQVRVDGSVRVWERGE